jgi:hypothetical protein
MKDESHGAGLVRRQAVVPAAEATGFLRGDKTALGVRGPNRLLNQARGRSGIDSTADLVKYALAKVVLEDDFGRKLVARRRTIPKEVPLGFRTVRSITAGD